MKTLPPPLQTHGLVLFPDAPDGKLYSPPRLSNMLNSSGKWKGSLRVQVESSTGPKVTDPELLT